jgi:hypothetical protein
LNVWTSISYAAGAFLIDAILNKPSSLHVVRF